MVVTFPSKSCYLNPLSSITKPPSKSSNPHSKAQNIVDPLLHYCQLLSHGRFPSTIISISALKACARLSAFKEGQTIHAQITKAGSRSNQFIATSLIHFYSAFGHLQLARRVFDEMADRDAALQTAMLVGYARNGDIKNARCVFDAMPERDTVAWNAMLSSYAQSGLPKDALELFREMQAVKVRPNEVTLVNALSSCSQLGCLTLGEWIHAYIDREEDIKVTSTLNNALVHMYAKCGRLDAAFRVFVERRPRNLESWNTMLTGFAIHGRGTSAVSLFSQIIKTGLMPDKITFICVLMACSHSGMIDHAHRCFNCMTRVYGMEPKSSHYGCMVDVLSRAGLLEEAQSLIDRMPFEPDAYIWGALLGGCLTHRSYELGLQAANHLLELEPWEESRYIALANLNVIAGKLEDAVKVRNMMIQNRIKKSSGSSSIEVDGSLHEFLAGDRSHCQSKEIYSMIAKIDIDLDSHEHVPSNKQP